jgi:hypothetical protein
MRRYVLTILGLLVGLLATAVGVSWSALDQCPLADRKVCGIVHFQEAKLAQAPDQIDVLLLGDSSLGHAVDAARFATLSGKSTLNLALVGSTLGLPAIDQQLKAVLAGHRVTNVVIMLSPETFRRDFERSAEGYVFISRGVPLTALTMSRTVAWESADALFSMLFDDRLLHQGLGALATGRSDRGDCQNCATFDFILQMPEGALQANDIAEWPAPSDDYDPFLRDIAATCDAAGVRCLYMHGPILQAALDLNPDYIAAIDTKAKAAGLPLVAAQPIIIPRADVGDAINHVRSDLRPKYTERIYRQIAPLLK